QGEEISDEFLAEVSVRTVLLQATLHHADRAVSSSAILFDLLILRSQLGRKLRERIQDSAESIQSHLFRLPFEMFAAREVNECLFV
ncbi:hypothetical protein PMAYCL1PPCAC_25007, partial [Pristionchus mayeri]